LFNNLRLSIAQESVSAWLIGVAEQVDDLDPEGICKRDLVFRRWSTFPAFPIADLSLVYIDPISKARRIEASPFSPFSEIEMRESA